LSILAPEKIIYCYQLNEIEVRGVARQKNARNSLRTAIFAWFPQGIVAPQQKGSGADRGPEICRESSVGGPPPQPFVGGDSLPAEDELTGPAGRGISAGGRFPGGRDGGDA
jgi:hypothetical protein